MDQNSRRISQGFDKGRLSESAVEVVGSHATNRSPGCRLSAMLRIGHLKVFSPVM
jgi:hypothetical protein